MCSRKVIRALADGECSHLASLLWSIVCSIGPCLMAILLLVFFFPLGYGYPKHASSTVVVSSPLRLAHLHGHSHVHQTGSSVGSTTWNGSHKHQHHKQQQQQPFNGARPHSKRLTTRRLDTGRKVKQQEQQQQPTTAKPSESWNQSENISHLLDQLLLGYDSHVRPDFGGPPIEVLIDFHIRSMGPISEIDMTYVIDCYFRQTWTDHRLAYKSMSILEHTHQLSGNGTVGKGDPYNLKANNGSSNQSSSSPAGQKALALSIYMLDRIWKPPTYFLNSRQSHMHMITLPNKFVRIYSNGRVLYSSRMTIKANCPMNLENFPMDTQRCPLTLGSFGYTSKDLIYNWNPNRKVVINPDMKMSQFDLIAVPVHSYNSSMQTSSIEHSFSVLVATFHFKRHMGSFVIEVYAPCIMLVVLSWVGFWINREATADRVTLGLTTVLTMTFLGLELRNDLPKVPYLTALDYFVYISFAFISATILEFGFVHFFTKIGSGEYYFMPIQDIIHEESSNKVGSTRKRSILSRRIDNGHMTRSADSVMYRSTSSENVKRSASWSVVGREAHQLSSGSSVRTPPRRTIQVEYRPVATDSCAYNHQSGRLSTFRNSLRNRLRHSFRQRPRKSCLAVDQNGVSGPMEETSVRVQLNSVSQIDRTSRVIFPIAFFAMNFMYWYIYLLAERNIDKYQQMHAAI